MAYTEYQKDWLEKTAKEPVTKADVKTAKKKQAARDAYLKDHLQAALDNNRAEIDKAQDLVIEQEFNRDNVWRKATKRNKQIKWRADDEDLPTLGWDTHVDLEVDTAEDIVDKKAGSKGAADGDDGKKKKKEDWSQTVKEVPPEAIRALEEALASILEIQQDMERQTTENGERLFSDDDIRRELWTPLVRSGLIPENMVPDKFSEQKRAFDGACEIYANKIKDFTESTSGHEALKMGLRIAKSTVTLVGTVASNAVAIHNDAEIKELKENIRTQGDTASDSQMDTWKNDLKKVENEQKWALAATAIAVGGLEIAEVGVDIKERKEREDWISIVDKTLTILNKIVSAVALPAAVEKGAGAGDNYDATSDAVKLGTAIQAGAACGFSAAKLGPSLAQVILAEEGERSALITGLIGHLADSVQKGIEAQAARDSSGSMKQIGASVGTAIRSIGTGPLVYKALKNGKPAVAAALLGGEALKIALSGASEAIYDKLHADTASDDKREASAFMVQFMELDKQEAGADKATIEKGQDTGSAGHIDAMKAQMEKLKTALQDHAGKVELDPMEDSAAAAFEKEQTEKLAAEALARNQKKLKEALGEENIEEWFADWDDKLADLEEEYAKLYPDIEPDGKPPTDADQALEALDRAIARTAELRAKVEIINATTGAAAGVLAALVPGAGFVAAAQKVAFDIYAVCKATELHNKWCESMQVAFRADSPNAAAIHKTFQNAQIYLSQSSVKLILDTVQLGAQVAKFADPTGAATVVAAATSITAAAVEYTYDMHKEAEIKRGWKAYKHAKENSRSRKAARRAMGLNSTLAKCSIAYGACMEKDPAAVEAIRISGLSVEVLQSETDVCNKLVTYLETELSNDPVVIAAEVDEADWHPGTPAMTAESWFEFKSAAATSANPRLSPDSVKTPGVDKLLAKIEDLWDGEANYKTRRDALKAEIPKPPEDAMDPDFDQAAFDKKYDKAMQDLAELTAQSVDFLEKLATALEGYKPEQAPSGLTHEGMIEIAEALAKMARMNLTAARSDKPPEADG